MKKAVSSILTAVLILCLIPATAAFAEAGYYGYQGDILRYSNDYHTGSPLLLDARLCALAAALALEQDGRKQMSAYRPNGEKWNTVFDDYGYEVVQASSGCNWMLSKTKPSAQSIVEYWMKTPGFKENVASAMYSHTGIYIHYSSKAKCYYVVQLFTKPASSQDTSFPAEPLAIATGNVNIRSGPGASYERLGKLGKGKIISIKSSTEKWASFTMQNGETGYAHTSYIAFITDQTSIVIDVPSTDPGTAGAAIATSNVNVRRGPGMNYTKLGKLRRGQTVSVWSINGKWAEITWTGSQKGYVHTDYLKFEGASDGVMIEVPSTDPGTIGAAIATGNVNVRQGPGKNYKRLGQLRRGQTIAVWSVEGKWAEITWTGSQRAYVHTDYLVFE